MKSMTLEEYEAGAVSIAQEVMEEGRVICVDAGDDGKFYIVRDDKVVQLASRVGEKY